MHSHTRFHGAWNSIRVSSGRQCGSALFHWNWCSWKVPCTYLWCSHLPVWETERSVTGLRIVRVKNDMGPWSSLKIGKHPWCGAGRGKVTVIQSFLMTAPMQRHHWLLKSPRPGSAQPISNQNWLFLFFDHTMWHVGSQFPNQGSNPSPLHWKCRVLTTRPPGKSRTDLLECFKFCHLWISEDAHWAFIWRGVLVSVCESNRRVQILHFI